MNPLLTKLRAQIKQCEDFISLCERIKHLEKLQDALPLKRITLETGMVEVVNQLHAVSGELQRDEATLNNRHRPVGSFEQQQLIGLIKNAQIRIGSLRLSVDTWTKQLARIDEDLISGARELEDLYLKLEEGINSDGLDPNSVGEKLLELRRERNILTEAIKADISKHKAQGKAESDTRTATVDGVPVHEFEFYEGLLADFAQAKKSVEIVSPLMTAQRAHDIMLELSSLAAKGLNVMVYTSPPDEQNSGMQSDAQEIIVDAHRLLITVVQRSGIPYNAAIIDNVICWEGSINILGTSHSRETMKRTVASSHVRELRHFLFKDSR